MVRLDLAHLPAMWAAGTLHVSGMSYVIAEASSESCLRYRLPNAEFTKSGVSGHLSWV